MSIKWFEVYRKFVTELGRFYQNNQIDPGRVIFDRCLQSPDFLENNRWINRLLIDKDQQGIDPFHILTSFNESRLGDSLRTRRLNIYLEILGAQERFGEIDYSGCPTPISRQIMARRSLSTQNEIWIFFDRLNQENASLAVRDAFADLKFWYGINITSLTIFLFWIDSKHFLSLDKNTVNYLIAIRLISSPPKNYETYRILLENPKIKDFRDIVLEAFSYQGDKQIQSSELYIEAESKTKQPLQPVLPIACRVLALRIFKDTDPKWSRVLQTGKLYNFYKAFLFDENLLMDDLSNDEKIKYEAFSDAQLYNIGGLDINIAAVVGPNGSGKSTLAELIFIVINNFTKKQTSVKNDLGKVNRIFLDFFFQTDSVYKLCIRGNSIKLFRYDFFDQTYQSPKTISLAAFDFERFFYTIAVNYSMYSLNSTEMGDWITALFHKNDQYQIPIVINPYRDKGNIDINKENKLADSRLLAMVLQPIEDFEPPRANTVRRLTDDKLAKEIVLTYNKEKLQQLYQQENTTYYLHDTGKYWQALLKEVCTEFGITEQFRYKAPRRPSSYIDVAFMYIVKKIVVICIRYDDYKKKFFNPQLNQFSEGTIPLLVAKLKEDFTHVTHKLYQAINFLRYDHLKELRVIPLNEERRFEISTLAFSIDAHIEISKESRFKAIHFIPPAFLKSEIILTGNISFSSLSSGEKQRAFSVSSLAYHLINIDSNADEETLLAYRSVNVMFDEVELYFHPEMQRSFVKYLLDYLSTFEFDIVSALNIIFVTHSPFILSDIPADNIIFLGEETPPNIKTFGNNIHTLLAESFFLHDSFMGDFARDKITNLVRFLRDSKELADAHWDQDKCSQMIRIIGEPLLKDRLLALFKEKFEAGTDKNNRIKLLKDELAILEA